MNSLATKKAESPNGRANLAWKMSQDQKRAYFWHLDQVYRSQGIATSADKESMRKLIHQRAFGRPVSAKEIDRLKMFDAFKAECLAWYQPANVDAQMRQQQMPLIRLRHRIAELADEAYILALVRGDRWKKQALEDLNEKELTDLRNTLCDRQVDTHKPETLVRRRTRARVEKPF